MSESFADRWSQLSPAKRALLEKRVAGRDDDRGSRIPPAPREGAVLASCSQERMWLFQKTYPEAIPYNSQVAIHFSGPLKVAVLRQCLDEIVSRHEIYRTTFAEVDGRVHQVIHAPHAAYLRQADLSHLALADAERAARRLIDEDVSRPFRLDELPLVRWTLLKLDDDRHILICMDHHAVTDGWSRNVVLKELMTLYSGAVTGGAVPQLPPPRLQFADFSTWQNRWLASEEGRSQVGYWRGKLAGCPDSMDLPYDHPHSRHPSFCGSHESLRLSDDDLKSMREIAAASGATMFMALLSVFLVLLHRYGQSDDICVGTGIANRRLADTDGLIGMLINTVALRADLAGNPSFAELVSRIRLLSLEAYANQEAPFEKVVEAVAPVRRVGVNPLYQVMFNLQNNPMPAMDFAGVEARLERPLFNRSAKFDLYVAGWPQSEQRHGSWQRDNIDLLLAWEYNEDVLDRDTVLRMQDHFRSVLRHASQFPSTPIAELRLDDDAERSLLTARWAGTTDARTDHQTIHAMFEAATARNPEATAIVSAAGRWNYRELNERAGRLAARLRGIGIAADQRVVVCMRRSAEMIATQLAILKAGGAYVPVDPDLPGNRIAAMVAICDPVAIIGAREHLCALQPGNAEVIAAEDAFDPVPDAAGNPSAATVQDLAYVLFTSGTTGVPKAVAVPHLAVSRLVRGADFACTDDRQTWLHLSRPDFDASTLEIWAPLCNGGRLVVMPPGLPSIEDIGNAIHDHGVTALWLTAGLFQVVVDEHLEGLAGLQQLLTGGDVVPMASARKVLARFPALRLINGYGPTENTTFTCCHEVVPADFDRRSLPIGQPIAGTTAYILDARQHPCPIGVPGELYAGGLGLARGYLGDAQATQEKFVAHAQFGRLYRTGDLCRRLGNADIEFLGRTDRQQKIRGFRIEPGEVESVLRGCPAVRDCAVAVQGSGAADKCLAAYVVAAPGMTESCGEESRAWLRKYLPDSVHPTHLLQVEQIPLTANGKVDFQALTASTPAADPVAANPTQPRTQAEEAVAAVWRQTLGRDDLGIHDDFFASGGHSLAALKVLALLKAKTGVTLRTLDFFELPTIAGIAARIEDRRADQPAATGNDGFLTVLRKGDGGQPIYIVPGGWGEANEVLVFAALVAQLRVNRPIYAVRSRVTERGRALPTSLEDHADAILSEIARTSPGQSVVFIGECAASTVALTLASRAEAHGRTVDSVILLDAGPPSHLRSVVQRAITALAQAPQQIRDYYKLLGSWQPHPLHAPLHLLLSSRFHDIDEIRHAWGPLAHESLQLHCTAGDHDSYIREQATDTARILEGILSGRDC